MKFKKYTKAFTNGQYVLHKECKRVYKILLTPHPSRRLEKTNEMFYAYTDANYQDGEKHTVWYRSKQEMEDGRFIAYDKNKQ